MSELFLHFGIDVAMNGLCLPVNLLLHSSDLAGKVIGDLGLLGMLFIHHFFKVRKSVFKMSNSVIRSHGRVCTFLPCNDGLGGLDSLAYFDNKGFKLVS